MTEIAQSRILITGAASGLGRALARRLAREGARLVLWDIDETNLEATQRELEATNGMGVLAYRCDVSRLVEVQAAAERVSADLGSIDVLVNNAGVVNGKSFLELSEDEIRRSFAVNTLSLFWTVRSFLPGMIAQGRGHLVTIASAAGLIGVPRLSDYSASKWAAVGLDESLRMELRRLAPRLRTTVVCPFYISTGLFAGARSRFGFLLPILEPDYAARRIVAAIRANKPRLVMPRFVHLVAVLRLAPTWFFDRMADLLGVNASMNDFVGRQGSAREKSAS